MHSKFTHATRLSVLLLSTVWFGCSPKAEQAPTSQLEDAGAPKSTVSPVGPSAAVATGDADGDGIPDAIERGDNTAVEPDTDADGTPDYLDLDSDDDGVPDAVEGLNDWDVDQIYDFRDTDLPVSIELGMDAAFSVPMTYASSGLKLFGRARLLSVLGYPEGSLPASLHFKQLTADGESSAEIPVDSDGNWSLEVDLVEGDNQLTVSADSVSAAASATITFNQKLALASELKLSEDTLYVGERDTITASIEIPELPADATVKLIQVNDSGQEEVTDLRDEGDADTGDDIAADGVYSAVFAPEQAVAQRLSYRIVVATPSLELGRSEVVSVSVLTPISDTDFELGLNKVKDLQAALDKAPHGDWHPTSNRLVAELKQDPAVADAGKNGLGSGVWVIYKNGFLGFAAAEHVGAKQGAGTPSPGTVVRAGSAKVKVFAANYAEWGENDDLPKIQKMLTSEVCLDTAYVKTTTAGSGNLDEFKNLGAYGVVALSTHGDSVFAGASGANWGYNGAKKNGLVALYTNLKVTTANRKTYAKEMQAGRMIVWYGDWGILPAFVTKYSKNLPKSLVYLSACRSTWNNTMADAFLKNGARAVLGYTDYVAVSFTESCAVPLFTELLKPDGTLAKAFKAGLKETDSDPAEFTMLGSDVGISAQGLRDGSFEYNSLGAAWSVKGDARTVSKLGDAKAQDGFSMAIVSTGLGHTTKAGSLTQDICICAGATDLTFDWNVYSEEFLEYVGSEYQDSFSVHFEKNKTFPLLNESIDTLAAGSTTPVENKFDKGDVYATGWRKFSKPVPAELKGQRAKLVFETKDVGDSAWDTAALIDNVKIAGCP